MVKQPQIIQLSLPQPCGEDWDAMTPDEQGRFCSACQRCVVDFTGWTDAALARFVASNKTPVCGRFTDSQLDRPLMVPPTSYAAKFRWLAAAGMLTFLLGAGMPDAFARPPLLPVYEQVMAGEGDSTQSKGEVWFTGTVIDNKKEPLINGTVVLKNEMRVIGAAVTDFDGKFRIGPMNGNIFGVSKLTLKFCYLGYKSLILEVPQTCEGQLGIISLNPDTSLIPKEQVVRRTYVVGKPLIEPSHKKKSGR